MKLRQYFIKLDMMRSRLAKVPTYCFSDVQINDLYILNIFLIESSTYTKS